MSMKRGWVRRLALALTSAGLLLGLGGTCLPDNFFANLAGDLIASAADAVVSDAVDRALDSGDGS